MLTYIYADELAKDTKLEHSMFQDRAWQFKERLNWDVSIDEDGHERDEYDRMNPLYVIWKTVDGLHGGSMRVMPTTAPCLVNDHFTDITGGPITSPLIWESTRFCLSPRAGRDAGRISAALMLAACEIGVGFGLKHGIGVFDQRMERVYSRIGWPPDVLGASGEGRERIAVGTWDFSEAIRHKLCLRAGVSPQLSRLWFNRRFGAVPQEVEMAQAV
ncbi:MAG: acyl-homoserine-lactone synthase [Pseudomonadota bacterium]